MALLRAEVLPHVDSKKRAFGVQPGSPGKSGQQPDQQVPSSRLLEVG